mmetsp:Transcript_107997/g.314177  ORF Transcript_107997/g.314177 Transcript_107997/m.314177 type:complete len:201 (-) Transcript_107997:686-1288(-)
MERVATAAVSVEALRIVDARQVRVFLGLDAHRFEQVTQSGRMEEVARAPVGGEVFGVDDQRKERVRECFEAAVGMGQILLERVHHEHDVVEAIVSHDWHLRKSAVFAVAPPAHCRPNSAKAHLLVEPSLLLDGLRLLLRRKRRARQRERNREARVGRALHLLRVEGGLGEGLLERLVQRLPEETVARLKQVLLARRRVGG